MKYIITKHNLHIEDSYKLKKKEIKSTLEEIKSINSDSLIWERSMFSLVMETVAHKVLYKLGLWKNRTKDVDLDNPCDKPEWLYIIIGILTWIFIR